MVREERELLEILGDGKLYKLWSVINRMAKLPGISRDRLHERRIRLANMISRLVAEGKVVRNERTTIRLHGSLTVKF